MDRKLLVKVVKENMEKSLEFSEKAEKLGVLSVQGKALMGESKRLKKMATNYFNQWYDEKDTTMRYNQR